MEKARTKLSYLLTFCVKWSTLLPEIRLELQMKLPIAHTVTKWQKRWWFAKLSAHFKGFSKFSWLIYKHDRPSAKF